MLILILEGVAILCAIWMAAIIIKAIQFYIRNEGAGALLACGAVADTTASLDPKSLIESFPASGSHVLAARLSQEFT